LKRIGGNIFELWAKEGTKHGMHIKLQLHAIRATNALKTDRSEWESYFAWERRDTITQWRSLTSKSN
jgi:hypothetical protein